jgi:hypothetical protein
VLHALEEHQLSAQDAIKDISLMLQVIVHGVLLILLIFAEQTVMRTWEDIIMYLLEIIAFMLDQLSRLNSLTIGQIPMNPSACSAMNTALSVLVTW